MRLGFFVRDWMFVTGYSKDGKRLSDEQEIRMQDIRNQDVRIIVNW